MPEKNQRILACERAETDAIFANLNSSPELNGEVYSIGAWLEEAIEGVKKVGASNIDWIGIARQPESLFCTPEELSLVMKAREENGARDSFSMKVSAIRYLQDEIIPAISACYPMLEQFVRTNFAITLVMRWYVSHDGAKYFSSPNPA